MKCDECGVDNLTVSAVGIHNIRYLCYHCRHVDDGYIKAPRYNVLECGRCGWTKTLVNNKLDDAGDLVFDKAEVECLLEHIKESHPNVISELKDEEKTNFIKHYNYDMKYLTVMEIPILNEVGVRFWGFELIAKANPLNKRKLNKKYMNVGKDRVVEIINKLDEEGIALADIVLGKNEKGNFQIYYYEKDEELSVGV